MSLYEQNTPEVSTPLYTAEDTVVQPDTTTGNYPILKGITAIATNDSDIPETINFNNHVDQQWRKTVPENNNLDRITAVNSLINGLAFKSLYRLVAH